MVGQRCWCRSAISRHASSAARQSGPLSDSVALGLSAGHSARDGFTVNDITGNDLDSRSATFGKAQLLWTPAPIWEARVIVSGERARDGDYALNDLGSLRSNPFHAARDFEGHTHRDIFNTTVTTRREGAALTLTTTTGFVQWQTEDETDLDYTPFAGGHPDQCRRRLPVHAGSAGGIGRGVADRAVDQRVAQMAGGRFPFHAELRSECREPPRSRPYSTHGFRSRSTKPRRLPTSTIVGVGLYGQGTLTLNRSLDLTLGARFDHERKQALLETFFSPALVPGTSVDIAESFSNLSPQAAVAYRFQPDVMVYASLGRGFKAGGFNPASPVGAARHTARSTR